MNSASSFIGEYDFHANGNDVLLLVIATLEQGMEDFREQKTDACNGSISDRQQHSLPDGSAFKQSRKKMEKLMACLVRPWNDDDSPYAGEYDEGEMTIPLKFIPPRDETLASPFQWLPYGAEAGEEEEGLLFYDTDSARLKTAFFVSLHKGAGSYMLYWDHLAPYLSDFEHVHLIGYNPEQGCITSQEYCRGEITQRHQVSQAKEWTESRLLLTPGEIEALNQTANSDDQNAEPDCPHAQENIADNGAEGPIRNRDGSIVSLDDHAEILTSLKNMQRWNIAESRDTPISQLVYLARFDEYRMSKSAARKTLEGMAADVCTLSDLRSYLDDEQQIRSSPLCGVDLLLLAFSSNSEIRKIIALQKTIPRQIVSILCDDEEGGIRFAARETRDGVVSWEV